MFHFSKECVFNDNFIDLHIFYQWEDGVDVLYNIVWGMRMLL